MEMAQQEVTPVEWTEEPAPPAVAGLTTVAVALLAWLGSGCGAAQPGDAAADPARQAQVRDAWVRPAGQGEMSAAYFVIRNGGPSPLRLVGADSDVAARTELHQTVQEGSTSRMEHVHAVEIPAGQEVSFRPGAYHVMLMDLRRDLNPGDTVKLTLEFEGESSVEVEATVR